MSSIESFDELEQKIRSQVEEALSEIREDFLGRLESTTERLDEVVNSMGDGADREQPAPSSRTPRPQSGSRRMRSRLQR